MLRRITPDQLWNKMQLFEKPLLIDISPVESFDRGYIRWSIHLPTEKWWQEEPIIPYISNPARDTVLVTETGHANLKFLSRVIQRLLGVDCLNLFFLEGGKKRWLEEAHTLQTIAYPPSNPFAPTRAKTPIPSEHAAEMQAKETKTRQAS
jgi:hypothetical protein